MNESITADKNVVINLYENGKRKTQKTLETVFGKNIFQPEVTDRIKSMSDVYRETKTNYNDFIASCQGLSPDEIAYRMAKLIAVAYNEGWVPDWSDSSEYKYFPWFKIGDKSGAGFSYYVYAYWNSYSGVGARLCFKSAKLATAAGKLFEQEVYKPLMTI